MNGTEGADRTVTSQRQSNVEVLRVMAMFFIVLGHYFYHYIKTNGALSSFDAGSMSAMTDYSLMELMIVFTSTGVNLFVLITGYFLIGRISFRLKGMVKVGITTIFYAAGIYLLFCVLQAHDFSLREFLYNLSPIPLHQYWFVAKYLGLLLVAPFLSRMVSGLEKKEYQRLLLILFVLFFEWPFGEMFGGGMSLSWFCFLYLFGGYIRRFGMFRWIEQHPLTAIFAIAVVIFSMHTATNVLAYMKNGAPFVLKYDANHSVTFFLSAAIFVYFVRKPMEGRLAKGISLMAPYTFAVYLIHEHSLMRGLIWNQIAPNVFPEMPLWLYGLVLCSAIFLCAVIIDFFRQQLFRLLHL